MQKMQNRSKLIAISVITILLALALDLYTKELILQYLPLYSKTDVLGGFLSLLHSNNYGAAFSFLNGAPDWFRKPFFIIVPLLAMGLVVFIMIKHKNSIKNIVAFSLILSGALGNFISRVCYGFVTDFIDVRLTPTYHWPTFNVADIAITIGVLMIFIDMIRIESAKKRKKAKAPIKVAKKAKRKKK